MTRNQRIGVTLGMVLGLGLLLWLLRGPLVPVFVAMFFAYLLSPVIDMMEKRGLNRSMSIVILAAVVLVGFSTVGTFFLVLTEREIADLVRDMPTYLRSAHDYLNPLAIQHLGREIPFTFEEIFDQARKVASVDAASIKPLSALVARVSTSTFAFVTWLLGLIIIPVFLFYFLRDWDLMKKQVAEMIPLAYRDYIVEKATEIDDVLAAFFRGQLTVAGLLGVIYSAGLLILGVNLAVVIGVVTVLAFIIPYAGTLVGVVAASVMVCLEYGISWRIPASWAVFAIGQMLEGFVLTPRITGEKVGLSPVTVIFSLMVGAEVFGFLGLLIAVPLAAVLNVILRDVFQRFRNSSYFRKQSC